jgi:hypothetical protein
MLKTKKKKTNLIRRKSLEQLNSFIKVIYNFFLRDIIGIAFGFQGANASPVLVPLVLPEVGIVSAKVFPVVLHIFK